MSEINKQSSDVSNLSNSDPLKVNKYKKNNKKFIELLFGTKNDWWASWKETKWMFSPLFTKKGFISCFLTVSTIITWILIVVGIRKLIYALGYNPPSFRKDEYEAGALGFVSMAVSGTFLYGLFTIYFCFFKKIEFGSERVKLRIFCEKCLHMIRSWEVFISCILIGSIFLGLDVISNFLIYDPDSGLMISLFTFALYGLIVCMVAGLAVLIDNELTLKLKHTINQIREED